MIGADTFLGTNSLQKEMQGSARAVVLFVDDKSEVSDSFSTGIWTKNREDFV